MVIFSNADLTALAAAVAAFLTVVVKLFIAVSVELCAVLQELSRAALVSVPNVVIAAVTVELLSVIPVVNALTLSAPAVPIVAVRLEVSKPMALVSSVKLDILSVKPVLNAAPVSVPAVAAVEKSIVAKASVESVLAAVEAVAALPVIPSA